MELCFHAAHIPADIEAAPGQSSRAADCKDGAYIIHFPALQGSFYKTVNNQYNSQNDNQHQQHRLENIQVFGNDAEQVRYQSQIVACQRRNPVAQENKIAECTERPYEAESQNHSQPLLKQKRNGK